MVVFSVAVGVVDRGGGLPWMTTRLGLGESVGECVHEHVRGDIMSI